MLSALLEHLFPFPQNWGDIGCIGFLLMHTATVLPPSCMQAFRRWVPSLRYDDVNVVLVVKGSALNGPVNIISYDIAIRMAKELKERKFQAVIAVRVI